MLKKICWLLCVLAVFQYQTAWPVQASSIDVPCDATIVGFMKFGDGLGRISIGIADALSKRMRVNFLNTRAHAPEVDGVSPRVQAIVCGQDKRPGKVAIMTDCLWDISKDFSMIVPQECSIKIAYSMFETDKLPNEWVSILNNRFDLVVVPDEYQVGTYEKSGVTTPILVLPPVCYLEEFLERKPTKTAKPFVFGNTSGLWVHKNQTVLIDAFVKAFGDRPDVKLVLSARGYAPELYEQMKNKVSQVNAQNIELRVGSLLPKEYLHFMSSLHVYISLSKGEGFSFCPREALALGTPVIICDHTSHRTLCNKPFVYSVTANLLESAYYTTYAQNCGHFFNCSIDEAAQAMKTVYQNYTTYQQRAQSGKKWVRRYLIDNLYERYCNLVKPVALILGEKNEVTNDYLMVNSRELYSKYKSLIDNGQHRETKPVKKPTARSRWARAYNRISEIASRIKHRYHARRR